MPQALIEGFNNPIIIHLFVELKQDCEEYRQSQRIKQNTSWFISRNFKKAHNKSNKKLPWLKFQKKKKKKTTYS